MLLFKYSLKLNNILVVQFPQMLDIRLFQVAHLLHRHNLVLQPPTEHRSLGARTNPLQIEDLVERNLPLIRVARSTTTALCLADRRRFIGKRKQQRSHATQNVVHESGCFGAGRGATVAAKGATGVRYPAALAWIGGRRSR